MNIIILGKTNVGKTPLSSIIKNYLKEANIISASQWVKKLYNRPEGLSKEEYVKDISSFSIEKLKENKDIDFVNIKNSLVDGINIIEGIRNPYTFNRVFEPNTDKIILLDRIGDRRVFSEFDKGIDVIKYNIEWLISIGLMKTQDYQIINYTENIEDEFNIENILKFKG